MSNVILSPEIEKSIVKHLRQQAAKSKKLRLVPDKKRLTQVAATAMLLISAALLVVLNFRLLEQFN